MDFETLLSVANNNKQRAKCGGFEKGYNTTIGPPKKLPKSNVRTDQIKQFLARKEQEEREKAVEAKKKKEQLLALRAQNTKNNKKAKIMASRTKDNDFSRIKLTDDDLEANQKRERELQALALKDKLERMKARIELVEKEKLLPHKRKRKGKHSSDPDNESHHVQNDPDEASSHKSDKTHSKEQNNIRKRPPPPKNTLNFHDLLRVAAEKQYQPVEVRKVVDVEDRPLSKKAKRLLQEEENRARRKLAAAANNTSLSRTNPDVKKAEPNIQNNGKLLGNHNFNRKAKSANQGNDIQQSSEKTHPTVVQLQKAETSKHKALSSEKSNGVNSNFKQNSRRPPGGNNSANRFQPSTNNQEKRNVPSATNFKKDKLNGQKKHQSSISENTSQKSGLENKTKSSSKPSKSKTKTSSQNTSIANIPSSFLSEDIMTQITNQIREKLQKELEEKLLKHTSKAENTAPETQKVKKEPVPNRTAVNPVKKHIESAKSESSKVFKQPQGMPLKKPVPSSSVKKSLPPKKAPPPKAFHTNPYLLPPRRLLESQRPIKPVKRRVESDDDDEDDDDDMDDFIDDSQDSKNQDDYSQYIKEIFNYDRSRYADVDDDDIEESSFAQVCQEEVHSAKVGYLEDLEEEKKEKAEMRRKMMKKKK